MGTSLLVVDVQPAYSQWCDAVVSGVVKRINNTRKPTIIMWVGQGVTNDTEEEVREYLVSHGARRSKLAQATFVEKDYGFFRGWMDNGVDSDMIVRVGRYMLQHRMYSSEDIDLEALLGSDEFEAFEATRPKYDFLMAPSFDETTFRYFDVFETCGGGSEECLAEIELYLQMRGKEFARLDNLVY